MKKKRDKARWKVLVYIGLLVFIWNVIVINTIPQYASYIYGSFSSIFLVYSLFFQKDLSWIGDGIEIIGNKSITISLTYFAVAFIVSLMGLFAVGIYNYYGKINSLYEEYNNDRIS